MVNFKESQLNATFAALADPSRRKMLEYLMDEDQSVGRLAERFDMSWPAVSRHLKILEKAGLLQRHKNGRVHTLNFDPSGIDEALHWIETARTFWEGSLDKLAAYLEEQTTHTDRSE